MREIRDKRQETSQFGISLVEVVVIIALIGFLVLIIGSLPNAMFLIGRSRHQSIAREIATKQIEDKRAGGYDILSNGDQTVSDSRLLQLSGGTGTITVADCDTSICSQGESTKSVRVTISWKESGKPQTLMLKTLISDGGLK